MGQSPFAKRPPRQDPGAAGRRSTRVDYVCPMILSGRDAGEATESLDAAYSGEPLRVGFNCVFLLDLLAVVKSGDIEIALKDAESATELRPVDQGEYRYRYVVMPMRP